MKPGKSDIVLRALLRMIAKWDRLERWAVKNSVSSGIQAAKEAKARYIDILMNRPSQ